MHTFVFVLTIVAVATASESTYEAYKKDGILRDENAIRCPQLLDPSRPKSGLFHDFLCKDKAAGDGNCACSCDDDCRVKQQRLQSCCEQIGVSSDCLPLCKYNLDVSEMVCNARKCAGMLQKWLHCAADSSPELLEKKNLKCCADNGIDTVKCRQFCLGKAPPANDLMDPDFMTCAYGANAILQCHSKNLPDDDVNDQTAAKFDDSPLSGEALKLIKQVEDFWTCPK